MRRTDPASKQAIVDAAIELLKSLGAHNVSVDAVARAAGCAKGLVHYHFKTKAGLFDAAAGRLAEDRRGEWAQALDQTEAGAAIEQSWHQLTRESDDGTLRAWVTLLGPATSVPDQTVRTCLDDFSHTVASGIERLLDGLGMKPTIPIREMGLMLAAVLHGLTLQLGAGVGRRELEGAFAAAWLGILSLSSPG